MSAVTDLNNFYGSFFKSAVPLISLTPYYYTFSGIAGNKNDAERFLWATITCTALTVIPVLPALTALTISLAIIGSILTGLTALVAYPVGLLMDSSTDAVNSFQPEI